jgi:hypothetical protein
MNTCPGCEHSLDLHVVAVSGRVVCLASWSHTSTGVIMTTTVHCDCIDHISGRKEAERESERQKRDRWDKFADDVRQAVERGEIIPLRPNE